MQEPELTVTDTDKTTKSIALIGNDPRSLLRAARARLDLAVRLAALTNSINPVVEINRALPENARPELPVNKSNYCACTKRISSNKLRCLSCQDKFLSAINHIEVASYETNLTETSGR